MKVELPYGHEKKAFEIDKKRLIGIFSPDDAQAVLDVDVEVVRSLENPIGMNGLRSIVTQGKKVAVAVDDNTRATPVKSFIPPLLRYFNIRKKDVVIIIALGTHRKMTDREMQEKYGPELLDEYEVINHAFDEKDQLKLVGKLPNGVSAWANREFLNADVRISTGNIIPHFTSGWSAGSKTLLPGLAGEETVGWMHYIGAMDLPNALGETENSSRSVMDAFAKEVGLTFIVNTVLNRSERIVKIFSGDFVKAHREGIRLSKRIYSVKIPELSDITVTSSYPADIEFWQGQKGLYSADKMTKKRGGILLLTPCPEGICVMHKDWGEMLQYDSNTLVDMIKNDKSLDLAAASLALCVVKTRELYEICVVSDGLSDKMASKLHFKKVASPDEGIAYLSRRFGENGKVSVLTHGGDTCPILQNS
jgi:nickel-dependent lactate racemase